MTPLLKFTVLRLALFVAALAALALLGARGWLLLLLAAVVSLALSYVLLRGPREELASSLAQRVGGGATPRSRRTGRRAAADRDAAVEDAAVEDAAGVDEADVDRRETP
jgi:Protein of unknown function (DUF4229)